MKIIYDKTTKIWTKEKNGIETELSPPDVVSLLNEDENQEIRKVISAIQQEVERPIPTKEQLKTINFIRERKPNYEYEIYRYWARQIQEEIKYSSIVEDKRFISKTPDDYITLFHIEENKYLMKTPHSYYYGFLLDNQDYYHFIGIVVHKNQEEDLFQVIEIDLESIFGRLF